MKSNWLLHHNGKLTIMQTKIIIPEPCHEDWNKMTPTEKGAFCTSCSKEVKDFTKSTDQEILEVLNTGNDQICGHINNSQLNRNLNLENSTPLRINWKIPFAASFGLLIAAPTVNAQTQLGGIKRYTKGDMKVVEKQKIGKLKVNQYQSVEPVIVCKLPEKIKTLGEVARIDTPIVHEDLMVAGMIVQIEEKDTVKPIEPKSQTPTLSNSPSPQTAVDTLPNDTASFKRPAVQKTDSSQNKNTNIEVAQVTIFPNPTQDWLNIKVEESALYNVNILSANGALILKKSFFGTALKINLSNQTSGIYYIHLYTSDGIRSKTMKVLKQ